MTTDQDVGHKLFSASGFACFCGSLPDQMQVQCSAVGRGTMLPQIDGLPAFSFTIKEQLVCRQLITAMPVTRQLTAILPFTSAVM
jgi:hypothetical protein